jgi:hypothetical protein
MAEGPSLLELCRELAYRMLAHRNFCPWNCLVDRSAGAKFGACKLASAPRVSSHFHHTGEELFYRGTEGSGTIFFTSCSGVHFARTLEFQVGAATNAEGEGRTVRGSLACGTRSLSA